MRAKTQPVCACPEAACCAPSQHTRRGSLHARQGRLLCGSASRHMPWSQTSQLVAGGRHILMARQAGGAPPRWVEADAPILEIFLNQVGRRHMVARAFVLVWETAL
jgi:hypothetical protein